MSFRTLQFFETNYISCITSMQSNLKCISIMSQSSTMKLPFSSIFLWSLLVLESVGEKGEGGTPPSTIIPVVDRDYTTTESPQGNGEEEVTTFSQVPSNPEYELQLALAQELLCNINKGSNYTMQEAARTILAKLKSSTPQKEEPLPQAAPQYLDAKSLTIFKYLPQGYDKYKVPLADGKWAVRCSVELEVLEVKEFDELNEIVTLDIEMGMEWPDGNLENFTGGFPEIGPDDDDKYHSLNPDFIKEMWTPDLFFAEATSVEQPKLMGATAKFNLWSSGEVYYRTRFLVKLSCEMDFTYYPADTQSCTFTLRSYAHHVNRLILRWNGDESDDEDEAWAIYLKEPTDPNFDFKISEYTATKENLTLGPRQHFPHTYLRFKLLARRKMAYHLVQTYAASILFVLVTWLGFFISADMFDARVAISMSTLLTITAMFAGIRETTPNVSYVKAIDVWMIACIFFIFTALCSFSVTAWVKRGMQRLYNMRKGVVQEPEIRLDEILHQRQHRRNEAEILKMQKSYIKVVFFVEKVMVYLLSFGFIAFNVIYWFYFLTASEWLNWSVDCKINNAADESVRRYCIDPPPD